MPPSYLRHDIFLCESWLIHWHVRISFCRLVLLFVTFSFVTHSHSWRIVIFVTFTCATWLISMWHDPFTCATWLIYMCDTTHSCVWHDPFICATWLIPMWHDSFTCATWLIPIWHDSFICTTWLIHIMVRLPVPWLIDMCDITYSYVTNSHSWFIFIRDTFSDVCPMTHWYVRHNIFLCYITHWYVRHDSFICMTWLIHMCDMIHSYNGTSLRRRTTNIVAHRNKSCRT